MPLSRLPSCVLMVRACALLIAAALCGQARASACFAENLLQHGPQAGAGAAAHGPPSQGPAAQDAPAAAATATPSEALGDLQNMRGRYLLAIRTFESLEPKTPAIWNKIGVASEHMLMFDKAKLSFEQAMKLDPNYAEPYNNLGTVYHSQGDLNRAEKLYRKAIKLKPKSADTYQNLGTLYYTKRKFKKGDEAYKQAILIDPGVLERSAQSAIQAQNKGKGISEIHYHLACTMAEAGKQQLALEYLRRSILEGFHDRDRLLREKEFADLRTTPVFLQMVDDLTKN